MMSPQQQYPCFAPSIMSDQKQTDMELVTEEPMTYQPNIMVVSPMHQNAVSPQSTLSVHKVQKCPYQSEVAKGSYLIEDDRTTQHGRDETLFNHNVNDYHTDYSAFKREEWSDYHQNHSKTLRESKALSERTLNLKSQISQLDNEIIQLQTNLNRALEKRLVR
jgi:hypothetical protein